MQHHYFPTPEATNTLSTEELRARFMISGLFQPGTITAHYTDLDRMIVGSALPIKGALTLPVSKALGSSYFLERREIGILNLGTPGYIRIAGVPHELGHLDCLYIGQGEKDVLFINGGEGQSEFFFISTPAHTKHPTALVRSDDVRSHPLGDTATANLRRIIKLIHPEGVKSCELVMGYTEFEPGSVWNTMPPHTHSRRTEIYLYFDLAKNAVVHLMGQPQETRHLIVRDREAVLSPAWSVHCGVGTGSYRFVWAMGGDNQTFADMEAVPIATLR